MNNKHRANQKLTPLNIIGTIIVSLTLLFLTQYADTSGSNFLGMIVTAPITIAAFCFSYQFGKTLIKLNHKHAHSLNFILLIIFQLILIGISIIQRISANGGLPIKYCFDFCEVEQNFANVILNRVIYTTVVLIPAYIALINGIKPKGKKN